MRNTAREARIPSGSSAIEIYANNHAVCAAAAQMSEHIEKLRQAGFILPDQAQFRLAWIEEIRAMTCQDVNMGMDDHEFDSAAAAEKRRLPIEQ